MTETQKKELWQIAEIFRGTKGSGNINDIVLEIIKNNFKPLIKEEYQNTNFTNNIDFRWQSTAPDNSVEYVQGTIEIDRNKLANNIIPFTPFTDFNRIDYGDGRIIFINLIPIFDIDQESPVQKFEGFGGIRYFKDGYISPLTLAEQHIENYFSVARLLQMKVWWDEIPHTSTPKLAAVYQWTADTTNSAIGGQTTFTPPPYTFDEITQEIASLS